MRNKGWNGGGTKVGGTPRSHTESRMICQAYHLYHLFGVKDSVHERKAPMLDRSDLTYVLMVPRRWYRWYRMKFLLTESKRTTFPYHLCTTSVPPLFLLWLRPRGSQLGMTENCYGLFVQSVKIRSAAPIERALINGASRAPQPDLISLQRRTTLIATAPHGLRLSAPGDTSRHRQRSTDRLIADQSVRV